MPCFVFQRILQVKVGVLHQGYIARAENLGKHIVDTNKSLVQSQLQRECFAEMLSSELQIIPNRLAKLEREVEEIMEREEALQREYTAMLSEAHARK